MDTKQKREKFSAEHVRAWRESELTQVQYCARNGISRASLQYWGYRKSKEGEALTLVPVQRRPVEAVGGCVLRGPTGWQVEFPLGTSAGYLVELLGGLR